MFWQCVHILFAFLHEQKQCFVAATSSPYMAVWADGGLGGLPPVYHAIFTYLLHIGAHVLPPLVRVLCLLLACLSSPCVPRPGAAWL